MFIEEFELDKHKGLDIGYEDKLFTPYCKESFLYIWNSLSLAGYTKDIDFLVAGSIIDFNDSENH